MNHAILQPISGEFVHLVVMTDEILLLVYESFRIYRLKHLVTTFVGHLVT